MLPIVIASILLIVPEVHSMSPITAFGQIPFLSDQPSSSSTNNQSNQKAPNYSSNASLTGISSTGNTTPTNSGGKGSGGGNKQTNADAEDDEDDIERFDIEPKRSWDSPVRTYRS